MSDKMTTETLDKLYLEYSNLTTAKTRKGLVLEQKIERLERVNQVLKKACERVLNANASENLKNNTKISIKEAERIMNNKGEGE